MNEHSLDDPQLAALEAQLAAMTLYVSPQEQQRLLYECGIAAGQNRTRKAVRRWRVVSAALVISLVGMSIPYLTARQASVVKYDTVPPHEVVTTNGTVPVLQSRTPIELDAWQSQQLESPSSSDELARLADSDPNLRSRTVGALTRQALESNQPL